MCNITGCEGVVYSKGLCQKHYMRERRHGSATEVKTRGAKKSFMREVYEEAGEWDNMLKRHGTRTRDRLLAANNRLLKIFDNHAEMHAAQYYTPIADARFTYGIVEISLAYENWFYNDPAAFNENLKRAVSLALADEDLLPRLRRMLEEEKAA
jgi:hypothetical protein